MGYFHLTPAALNSFAAIGRYTESMWGRKQRDIYLGALDRRFHALAESPATGRMRNEICKGLRSFHEGKHVIFYLSCKGYIVVVDMLHERMEPAPYLPEKFL